MTMQAIVLSVQDDGLMVLDLGANRQRVWVHYPRACRFQPGNRVCIRHNGVMTMSLPPQITAQRITLLSLSGNLPCR